MKMIRVTFVMEKEDYDYGYEWNEAWRKFLCETDLDFTTEVYEEEEEEKDNIIDTYRK